ncbi:MAG: hypothetical protein ACI9H8_001823 [Lysobacterales bacterium]|jgi:hypothetical protein
MQEKVTFTNSRQEQLAGLGESEGEFADTHFSSNVQDLIDAAGFMAQTYKERRKSVLPGARSVFALISSKMCVLSQFEMASNPCVKPCW